MTNEFDYLDKFLDIIDYTINIYFILFLYINIHILGQGLGVSPSLSSLSYTGFPIPVPIIGQLEDSPVKTVRVSSSSSGMGIFVITIYVNT